MAVMWFVMNTFPFWSGPRHDCRIYVWADIDHPRCDPSCEEVATDVKFGDDDESPADSGQPRTSYRHSTEMMGAQTVFEGFLDELELELSRELSAIELDKMGTAPSSNNLGRATMGSLPVRMQMLR